MRIAGLLATLFLSGTLAAQTSGLLSLPPSTDPGTQKARQLLERMVTALGGQAYLNVQDLKQQGRSYGFRHGEPQGAGVLFTRYWKWPDKERVDFREWLGGVQILPGVDITSKANYSVVYSGDAGQEITFRGIAALDSDLLQDYQRRRRHSLPWVLRKWLKEPGIILLYEGRAIAERKPAEQVSILTAQNDSATIFMDSSTHLPLKVTFTWRDPKTRERAEEAEGYDNYRSVQGVMTPFSVTRYHNGEAVSQRFVNSTSYNQGLDDTVFSAKAVAEATQKK
ncbi:MAG: hypothetical protein ACE14L_16990 [Terriglobales bacterium]